ncbi:MAG: MFS transporter [Candidatus Bathyarchaeia archaeon]
MEKDKSPTKILLVTTLSHVMQHIYVGSSVLLPLIIEELGLNYTEFGLAIAASSLIGGLSQIIFSVASRRIARHILLGLGNILLSAGTFLTGLSHKLLDFLFARLLSNVGVAPQHPMGTAIVSESFDEKSLGRAIGIHYGLAYVGNIVGPVLMTSVAIALGWRNTLFIFSIPAFLVGLTVIWYLSERKRGKSEMKESLNETNLRSDILALIKTRGVILILAAQALFSGGIDIGVLTTYIPIFLAGFLMMDIYERGAVYTIGLFGGVVGPIILGAYAGRAGYIKVSALSAFFASIITYLLAFYKPGANGLLLALHLFTLMFTAFSLPTLLQSHLVRVTSGYNRDLVVGLFFTSSFVFNSLWTGLIGYTIDAYASFKPALIMMGTLGLIALAMLVIQNMKKC